MKQQLIKEQPVLHDVHIIGELLGKIVIQVYDQETYHLVETIRFLSQKDSDETLETLFTLLEELSEQQVMAVLRSFGLFLALLTIVQRAHKVKDYQRQYGLSLDLDSLYKGISPKLHLVFCTYPYETLSMESNLCFQQLFDVIYRYRQKTDAVFDQQTLDIMSHAIQGLFKYPLQPADPCLYNDSERLMDTFKNSIYKSIGVIFAEVQPQHIALLGNILKCSTWVGGDYEHSEMNDDLLEDVLTLYEKTLKSCYIETLDHLRTTIKNFSSFTFNKDNIDTLLKVAQDSLQQSLHTDDTLECIKRGVDQSIIELTEKDCEKLILPEFLQFRAQLEIFGRKGLGLEVKFNIEALVSLIEAVYQKIYQRRLKRLFDDNPQSVFKLLETLSAEHIRTLSYQLSLDHQKKINSLLNINKIYGRGLDRIIVSDIVSVYQFVALRVVLGILIYPAMPFTPVFERVESIDESVNLLDQYVKLCQQAKVEPLLDEVMMGYADCAKEASFWSAQTKIYHAQCKIEEWAIERNLPLQFFQGRGGSIARGGFPTKHLIATSLLTQKNPNLKLTIQGETIRQRFGSTEIASMTIKRYLLEIKSSLEQNQSHAIAHDIIGIREDLALASTQEFEYYTQEEQDFYDYFYAVTPIDFVMNKKITADHRQDHEDKKFKATEWFFCWSQNRFFIPVWLGMGAICHSLKELTPKELEKIFDDRFVYSTFMLVLVSLSKIDLRIVKQYQKELASPHLRELGEAINVVYNQVIDFSDHLSSFYDNDPYFNNFIEDARYRSGYLVPLHLLQIEMLRRYRARKDIEIMKESIFLESILLISVGLQNSG